MSGIPNTLSSEEPKCNRAPRQMDCYGLGVICPDSGPPQQMPVVTGQDDMSSHKLPTCQTLNKTKDSQACSSACPPKGREEGKGEEEGRGEEGGKGRG
eukprot:12430908-Karenia_brevis.AAC.1